MFPWRCQPRRNERIKFNDTEILHEYVVKERIIFQNVIPRLRLGYAEKLAFLYSVYSSFCKIEAFSRKHDQN